MGSPKPLSETHGTCNLNLKAASFNVTWSIIRQSRDSGARPSQSRLAPGLNRVVEFLT